MKNSYPKYLILILIALFFASTNELDPGEAAQNYAAESHSFIQTDIFSLTAITEQHEINHSKNNSSFSPINLESFRSTNLFRELYLHQHKFISQFFPGNIYLDISSLRI